MARGLEQHRAGCACIMGVACSGDRDGIVREDWMQNRKLDQNSILHQHSSSSALLVTLSSSSSVSLSEYHSHICNISVTTRAKR